MSREEKKERRGGIRAGRESTDCSVYLVEVRMNGLGCLNAEKTKNKKNNRHLSHCFQCAIILEQWVVNLFN